MFRVMNLILKNGLMIILPDLLLQVLQIPNLKTKTARRESAKRAAILNAQYQVLEKFKGSKIEGAAGMSDFENTGIAIAQEIQGVVKGGSVIKCNL